MNTRRDDRGRNKYIEITYARKGKFNRGGRRGRDSALVREEFHVCAFRGEAGDRDEVDIEGRNICNVIESDSMTIDNKFDFANLIIVAREILSTRDETRFCTQIVHD